MIWHQLNLNTKFLRNNINPHIVAKPSSIKVLKLSNQKLKSIIQKDFNIKQTQIKKPLKERIKTTKPQKVALTSEVRTNKNQEEKTSDLKGIIFVFLIVIFLILFVFIF